MKIYNGICIAILVIGIIIIGITSCNEQNITKTLGGTMEIELDPGRKLEEITWKDDNLWILTRPMRDGEIAEKHEFVESSGLGVCEGKVIIIEKVKK